MVLGDSVRVYESDNFFIEGKIKALTKVHGKIRWIRVDWDEFVSVYKLSELELEHRDGTWSWKPLTEGKIIS